MEEFEVADEFVFGAFDGDAVSVLEMDFAVGSEDEEFVFGDGLLSAEVAFVVGDGVDVGGGGEVAGEFAEEVWGGVFLGGVCDDAVEGGLH